MNLLKVYNAVDRVLNTLDFDSLFSGFHKYRFALYTSREICLDGEMIPYQEGFLGNTAIEYKGEYIAIWNMELDPIEDVEILAYSLVHEMFHCQQKTNKDNRYPSDLTLLNYPTDTDNFTKKYNENLCLADAYEKRDLDALKKFVQIRNMRLEAYPEMVRQELKAETMEGMAEYVGLRALNVINKEKCEKIVSDYIGKLQDRGDLLFDIRRISYYVGAIYYLCFDRLEIEMQNDFLSELSVYEQNPIDCSDIIAEIEQYDFISSRYAELLDEKKRIIEEYIKDAKYVACDAYICGYDPMNMIRFGDMIYCKYFVFLNESGKIHNISSAAVLKLAENSNKNVVGYYIK